MEKLPRLVDQSHFKIEKIKDLFTPVSSKKFNSFYLNILLLVLFIGFFIFFLINCKYGMFKSLNIDPIPFTFSSV